MKIADLRKLFTYDKETGNLIWLVSRGRMVKAGDIAGTVSVRGYRIVTVNQKKLPAHRIAWMLENGPIPEGLCIDHIDGDKLNNRLSNLRVTTLSGNQRNRKMRHDNKTGYQGVHPTKSGYSVSIAHKYIGHFMSLEAAVSARRAAEQEHNFHPNHGRKA